MTKVESPMTYAEFGKSAPAVRDALLALGAAVDGAGLDKELTELVKIRASQLNGCAFCLQLHLTVARRLAVPADKLDLVSVWRDTDLFSDRERAALAWTEVLTQLGEHQARRTAYDALGTVFTETEILYLTTTIGTINQWNRIAIGLRFPPQLATGGSSGGL